MTEPRKSAAWIYASILGVVVVAYLPALSAGFIWDDQPGHVTRPELQSWAGLARIWFEVGATQQYYPLLHTTFWIEHQLWGDWAAGYHLVNVLWHATAACLVGALLRQLAVPGAWLAAFLFALHPVMVESVAWISEQKNTLSTVFSLAAVLAYLRYDDTRTGRWYGHATVRFILALLTKTVTATLPAALLVLLWWRRGRLEWRRDVRPLLPWFALSVTAGVVTALLEHAQIGAQGSDFALGPIERVLVAGRALWFYVGKLLWPANLSFIYPRWTVDAGQPWQWAFPIATIAVLTGLWALRRRNRAPLAVALLFAGVLFPALGFVNVFPFIYSFVADHFQYLAAIGIFAGAGAVGARWLAHFGRWTERGVLIAIAITLGVLTWRQAENYRDVFTLYRATLAQNPSCWMAHNNLGIALVERGRAAEALDHYAQAIALRPNYAEAENNFGYALNQLSRPADALPHLQRALELRPQYAEARNNLGVAFMALGRTNEGIVAFATAARLNPRYAMAHLNHGLALASSGQAEAAIPLFRHALELDPNYAEAELNWGIALVVTGQIAAALPHFERATALRPDAAHIQNGYGRALAAAGRLDEAVTRYRESIRLQPGYAEAHFNLAVALRQLGRRDEAEDALRTAQQLGWR